MSDQISNIQLAGWVGYLCSLYLLYKRLPLRQLIDDKKVQHLVFGASVSLFVLWLFRTGIYEGLNVHFLWLTALTLLLGFRWALISGLIALFGVTAIGSESWSMFGINGLLAVTAPITVTYFIYNFSFHKLPRHFFIYVFVCSFFTGALIMAIKMSLIGSYYYLDDIHSWEVVRDNYLMLIPLMLFSEAMLNGMTMTLLVIYKPTWVYTFYDKYYIEKK